MADSESSRHWLHDLTRFMKHFPLKIEDVSLIVLKGHLLTEELLREFLHSKVLHPSPLRDARLRYIQCVHLARSLSTDPGDWVWDALDRLNVIRNKLSHALEPTGLDDAINAFGELVRRNDPRELPDTREIPAELRELFTPLGFALFSVHAALSAMLRVKPVSLLGGAVTIPSNQAVQPTAEDGGG